VSAINFTTKFFLWGLFVCLGNTPGLVNTSAPGDKSLLPHSYHSCKILIKECQLSLTFPHPQRKGTYISHCE